MHTPNSVFLIHDMCVGYDVIFPEPEAHNSTYAFREIKEIKEIKEVNELTIVSFAIFPKFIKFPTPLNKSSLHTFIKN